jgi:hypothetical protein
MTQTNTQAGDVLRKPHSNVPGALPTNGLDLTGRLFVQRSFAGTDNKDFVNPAGSPAVLPHFVCTEGVWGDKHITVRPLSPTQPVRVRLKGTCNPGDRMEAVVATSWADAGYACTQTSEVGEHGLFGIAEEFGVDGQLVLIRPINPHFVTVT